MPTATQSSAFTHDTEFRSLEPARFGLGVIAQVAGSDAEALVPKASASATIAAVAPSRVEVRCVCRRPPMSAERTRATEPSPEHDGL
jgi:hypothetical protein